MFYMIRSIEDLRNVQKYLDRLKLRYFEKFYFEICQFVKL